MYNIVRHVDYRMAEGPPPPTEHPETIRHEAETVLRNVTAETATHAPAEAEDESNAVGHFTKQSNHGR